MALILTLLFIGGIIVWWSVTTLNRQMDNDLKPPLPSPPPNICPNCGELFHGEACPMCGVGGAE